MEEPEVLPADDGAAREAFLALPYTLNAGDPAFVPPLRKERVSLLDPRHNAFLAHAEVALRIARTAGRVTGRLSLQLDREEEKALGVRGATFGLFEAADAASARVLLADAEAWARVRGATRIRGPFSLSINQETGLLVDGFDLPPMVLMPHNPPSYAGFIESAGFVRVRDLYAWRLRAEGVPRGFRRAAEKAAATPGLAVRSLDLARLADELERVRRVFNSAWSKNWGFVPMTDAEIAAMARDLELIADPRIALLAEVEGEPVGIAIALPNLNEAIRDLDGRLLPLGWARLMWRLKVRGLTSARLALLGLVEAWRGARGLGLTALLLTELHDRARVAGYRDWEIPWVLEENRTANEGARAMGAVRAKTYRLYEKALA